MSRKLTAAQRRCLISVANGTVRRVFDIWSGYQWQEGEFRTGWRKYEHQAPSPITRLAALGLIEVGPDESPYSGRSICSYRITDAGRLALKEAGDEA